MASIQEIANNKETWVNWFYELLDDRTVWKKQGRFLYRPAILGETILTIVAGKLETIRTVNDSDLVVVKNIILGSAAETYIVSKDKFMQRYDIVQGSRYVIDSVAWFEAAAKGEVVGFVYSGSSFRLKATWGEDMLVVDGDFIAHPVNSSRDDIYRIEKEVFSQTYSLKEPFDD